MKATKNKTLNKCGQVRRVPRSKASNFKKECLAKLHLHNPQEFWNNVPWTDKIKEDMFGQNAQRHICRKQNTAQTLHTNYQK